VSRFSPRDDCVHRLTLASQSGAKVINWPGAQTKALSIIDSRQPILRPYFKSLNVKLFPRRQWRKSKETETFRWQAERSKTVKNSTNKNQAFKCEKIAKSIIK